LFDKVSLLEDNQLVEIQDAIVEVSGGDVGGNLGGH